MGQVIAFGCTVLHHNEHGLICLAMWCHSPVHLVVLWAMSSHHDGIWQRVDLWDWQCFASTTSKHEPFVDKQEPQDPKQENKVSKFELHAIYLHFTFANFVLYFSLWIFFQWIERQNMYVFLFVQSRCEMFFSMRMLCCIIQFSQNVILIIHFCFIRKKMATV